MARQLELWEDTEGGEETAPAAPDQAPGSSSPIEREHGKDAPGADMADPAAVESLRKEICRLSGMHVHLKVTNNSHSMMRVVHEPGGQNARLSLHWIFVDAPQAVVRAVAAWVKSPRTLRKNSLVKCYMRENAGRIPASGHRRVTIRTKGAHYDLAELYDEVNAAEFDGAVNAQITWGVMQPVGSGRSGHFRLGSYTDAKKLIRIHPVLDNEEVPAFVVRSIVFHEMLHAFLGIEKEDGKRRKVHHAAFKQREEQYRDHKAAEAWINNAQNMRLLAKIRKFRGLWMPSFHRFR
jgi:hypothetical protein